MCVVVILLSSPKLNFEYYLSKLESSKHKLRLNYSLISDIDLFNVFSQYLKKNSIVLKYICICILLQAFKRTQLKEGSVGFTFIFG